MHNTDINKYIQKWNFFMNFFRVYNLTKIFQERGNFFLADLIIKIQEILGERKKSCNRSEL